MLCAVSTTRKTQRANGRLSKAATKRLEKQLEDEVRAHNELEAQIEAAKAELNQRKGRISVLRDQYADAIG